MFRKFAICSISLILFSAPAPAKELTTPAFGCWQASQFDQNEEALGSGAEGTGAKASATEGACFTLPQGARYVVEKWSGNTPCIRLQGFDRCLWVKGLDVNEAW